MIACRLAALSLWLALAGLAQLPAAAEEKPWSAEFRVKRLAGSHTSYEFANPFPPNQEPLSRLEFPLDSWWFGGGIRRRIGRFSVGGEFYRNVNGNTRGAFKDSDWESEDRANNPLTVYSESQNRLERSFMASLDVDMTVGDWLHLPRWLDLRPVAGVRWQDLNFVTHDGVQVFPAPGDTTAPEPLPGDGIRFNQTYRHAFLGLRVAYDLEEHLDLPGVRLSGQWDCGDVDGWNEDYHLRRSGDRRTFDNTRGRACHASFGLLKRIATGLDAGLQVEHMRLRTTGAHRHVNRDFGMDLSWSNGVVVWSRQTSVMLRVEYRY
jgi:hypothetical protein